jgi:hypothetical protein
MKKKFQCPCCGYYTLDENPPGTYQICPVCFWEDDQIDFYNDIDLNGGANKVSLREARNNYTLFGATEQRFLINVRKPLDSEKR